MGKEFKNMDELFRSELGGSVSEAPAFVKDRIDASLGFKRKRFGLWLGGSLLLLLGLTAGIYYYSNSQEHVNQLALTENSRSVDLRFDQQELQDTPSVNEQSSSTDLIAESTGENRSALERHDAYESQNNQLTVSFGSLPNGQNSPNEEKVDDANAIAIPNPLVIVEPTADLGNESDDDLSTTQPDNTLEETDDQNNEADEAIQPIEDEDRADDPNQPLTDNSLNDNQTAPATESNKDSENPTDEIASTEEPENTELADNKESGLESGKAAPEMEIDPEQPAYQPLMLSVSSGINFTRSNYDSNNMNEAFLYNTSLDDKPGWQVNADLTYRFKNGLTFGTGLAYSQFNEAYTYQHTSTELETTTDYEYEYDYEYIYDFYLTTTIGDTSEITVVEYVADSIAYVSDSTLVTTVDTVTNQTNYNGRNQFSYLQIPLRIGTQMRFGKVQVDLFADTRLNFLTMSQGNFFEDGTLQPFTMEDPVYRKFYVDVMLGTRVHYQLTNHLFVNASLQYRPVIGNTYQPMTLSKSFDYFHTGIGLSWRF